MKLTLFFLLLSSVITAQVPGYLGKRVSIEMNAFVSPTVFVFEDSATIRGNEASRVKMNYQFALNYAVSRRMELSIKYRQENDFIEYSHGIEVLVGGDVADFAFSKEFDDQLLKYQYFDVGVRLFTKPFIAPVGAYHELIFGVVQFRHPEEDIAGGRYYYNTNYQDQGGTWYYTTTRKELNVQKFGFHYRLGYAYSRKKVLTNKLMFHYSFQANFHIKRFEIQPYSATLSEREIEEEILNTLAIKYKRWTDIFSVKLGLSYALF